MGWRVVAGFVVLGLGAGLGLARSARFAARTWPEGETQSRVVRIGKTMDALKPHLPDRGEIGYEDRILPDFRMGDESDYTFLVVQYALAPRVVRRDADAGLVIVRSAGGFNARRNRARGRP